MNIINEKLIIELPLRNPSGSDYEILKIEAQQLYNQLVFSEPGTISTEYIFGVYLCYCLVMAIEKFPEIKMKTEKAFGS
ncbi:MAG: hypothetical protein AAF363_18375 [Bacteroidota bacterium]